MTRFAPQWLQNASYAASVDRRLLGALWPRPASQGGAVTPAGTGMALQAAPGQVAVPAGNLTGSVLCSWDAPETVTLDPAPPSGTNRIDLIICDVQSADVGGSGADEFLIHFLKGAEAATPVAPTVPANAVALAQIGVTGGAAAILQADIMDRRPFGLAIGAGRLPPPVAAGAPTSFWTDDAGQVWVARGTIQSGAWRLALDVLKAKIYRAAGVTIGQGMFPFDTVYYDQYGMFTGPVVATSNGLRVPAGLGAAMFRASCCWASTSTIAVGQQYGTTLFFGGREFYGSIAPMSHNINAAWFASTESEINPGELIQMNCITGTVNMNPQLGTRNYLEAHYTGVFTMPISG